MSELSHARRLRLGESLRDDRDRTARALTDGWFGDHPEFESAHPPVARQRTREDFGYLLDFLAAAIEAGSSATFAEMVAWTARVLEARSVPRAVLEDSLGRIEGAVGEGLAAPEMAAVRSILAAGRTAVATPPTVGEASCEPGLAASVFVEAALHGDRQAALTVALEALREGAGVADVYLEILQAAMYEVGRRWEANRITVADEHLATAITQWVLAQLYPRLELPPPSRGRAVITGIEGELHQVGANMVADVLEADGWGVRFLGANVPHAAILDAVEQHAADVLGISATMVFHLARVERIARDARERFGQELRIVVGGGAFRFTPLLAAEVGADAHAGDLKQAVATLREL